ncbi:MAG: thiamine diphosphokinase [Eubacterium sp.]|nr:thiamine diphosphokinase [Eubacterium sp.]
MKTVQRENRVLIVSGGSIDDAFVLDLLEKNGYETVIACDSGMEFFRRNGLYPDLILGDFDSADRNTVDYFKEQTKVRLEQFPAQKDWTDTELAVRRGLELEPEHMDLVGATGTRLDHVLGNLQLLALGLEAGVQIFLMDAHNRIRLADRPLKLTKSEQYGDFISLIPYGGEVSGLTLKGMKYPLDGATLRQDVTLGISNEIVDDEALIFFTEGKLYVMETKD